MPVVLNWATAALVDAAKPLIGNKAGTTFTDGGGNLMGVDPQLAVTYFTDALGAPPEQEGGVEIWYDVGHLAAVAASRASSGAASAP